MSDEHLHVHHYIHVDPEAMGFFRHLLGEYRMITDKLSAAVAASMALATAEANENAALKAYIADEPNRSAATVAAALAQHDVDEDAAADTISQALTAAQASVNDSLTALTGSPGNPAATGGDTSGGSSAPAGGGGTDSITGATGDDSVTGGNGTDSIVGGNADDSVTGGQGNDAVSPAPDSVLSGQGNDAVTAPDNANPASVPADPTSPDPAAPVDPNAQ